MLDGLKQNFLLSKPISSHDRNPPACRVNYLEQFCKSERLDAVQRMIASTAPQGPQRISRGHQLNSIESLRGVAALMVICYHTVALMKVPAPAHLQLIETHFGLGVPLFYALSGFVLAYGFADRLGSREAINAFYIRRIARIAPLFYSVSLTWIVINWLLFSVVVQPLMLLLNFSFLFGLVPVFHESIAWAGWSIGVEMLFYAIFPVLMVVIGNVRTALICLVVSMVLSGACHSAFAAAGLKGYAYMSLTNQSPFFMAGITTFFIWKRWQFQLNPRVGQLLLVAVIALFAVVVFSTPVSAAVQRVHLLQLDFNICSVLFGMLILACCLCRFAVLEHGPLRQFGKLSFSAYLLHPMVMLALIRFQILETLEARITSSLLVFLIDLGIALGIIYLVSSLTYRWIELPGIALGRRLSDALVNRANAIRVLASEPARADMQAL